jgi:hypothetical protein
MLRKRTKVAGASFHGIVTAGGTNGVVQGGKIARVERCRLCVGGRFGHSKGTDTAGRALERVGQFLPGLCVGGDFERVEDLFGLNEEKLDDLAHHVGIVCGLCAQMRVIDGRGCRHAVPPGFGGRD